jgi:hypothetical protein
MEDQILDVLNTIDQRLIYMESQTLKVLDKIDQKLTFIFLSSAIISGVLLWTYILK